MKLETLKQCYQALVDNAAGNPLAQVHRNNLFAVLEECMSSYDPPTPEPPPVEIPVNEPPEVTPTEEEPHPESTNE